MTRSAQASPEAWREGCDLLASVAEDNARMLHELAKADTPLTAAALLAQYWQDMARKSFDHLVQTAVPQKA
ncbi:MAG: hypothetical protein EP341_04070 [Sphingomonadales bacterium]|nr:MAG: hypothetical protein EP341_04070 [Sphingomonadales bacterium]